MKNVENKEEVKKEKNTEKNLNKEKKVHKPSKEEKEIEALNTEVASLKDKAMRIQAEMMNFKRRKEEEVSNLYKYANEDILKKLIKIVDNFERALSLKNEENQKFLEGFEMIYTSILNILEENEVKEIDSLNKPFDPNFHQAVLTESKDGVEAGVVIDVLQKGYMYKDKVLRTAMVKVSE